MIYRDGLRGAYHVWTAAALGWAGYFLRSDRLIASSNGHYDLAEEYLAWLGDDDLPSAD